MTPLYLAAQKGHTACVEFLLAKGIEVDKAAKSTLLKPSRY